MSKGSSTTTVGSQSGGTIRTSSTSSSLGAGISAGVSVGSSTPSAASNQLAQAKTDWWNAKATGDQAAMDKAHAAADKLRAQGATLDAATEAKVNSAGQKTVELADAKRAYWDASAKNDSAGMAAAHSTADTLRTQGATLSQAATDKINAQGAVKVVMANVTAGVEVATAQKASSAATKVVSGVTGSGALGKPTTPAPAQPVAPAAPAQPSSTNQKYVMPVSGDDITISAGYGNRLNYPKQGQTGAHGGVDFHSSDIKVAADKVEAAKTDKEKAEAAKNAPVVEIRAITDGKVTYSSEGGLGYHAVVTSKDGTVTTYGHMVPIAGSDAKKLMGDTTNGIGLVMKTTADKVTNDPKYASVVKMATNGGGDVKQGDVIGFMGSTGNSFGPHVHVEMKDSAGPINPEKALPGASKMAHSDGDAPAPQ
ncbi:MAG: M23 family metallopeptidase [Mycobacterium leprae]